MKIQNSYKNMKNAHIPFIHNYCDRWCERCTHTRFCKVFDIEEKQKEVNADSFDVTNQAFWNYLSQTLQSAMETLQAKAQELGIDLSADKPLQKAVSMNVALEKLAKEYGISVSKWLNTKNILLQEQAKALVLIEEEKLNNFANAIEAIQWYGHFIGAKIHRALLSFESDNEADDENYDNLGSAKIALIAIQRSIDAFALLYNNLPEEETDILNFLSDLTKMKKGLEIQFPTAWQFVRPGFDGI